MANFGFWNIDSRYQETDRNRLISTVADLAVERSLDLLFLIECSLPAQTLISAFGGGQRYSVIPSGERFKVLARFDHRFMERQIPLIPSKRFDIWHLKLPLQEDVLVCVVHGLDKRNNSLAKQELFLRQVVAAISYLEDQVGHDRTIVLGDFNANPFESPVASATGMHAVSSEAIALRNPRQMLHGNYPFFYNPMWNLFGDQPSGSPPATYYYRGSDPHELYWHMLDQVIIRPSLLSRFVFNGLEIVTTVGGVSLTAAGGEPDRIQFSDHLPVVFGVDLLVRNGEGVQYA